LASEQSIAVFSRVNNCFWLVAVREKLALAVACHEMSTKKLIIAAAICGIAILLASAVQLVSILANK
jgi:hypothetical protein